MDVDGFTFPRLFTDFTLVWVHEYLSPVDGMKRRRGPGDLLSLLTDVNRLEEIERELRELTEMSKIIKDNINHVTKDKESTYYKHLE